MLFRSSKGQTSQIIKQILRHVLPNATVVARDEQLAGESALLGSRALIEKADFIVFDIAEENPNVFFELGFAQALKKRTAVLMPRGVVNNLASDLAGLLYLSYDPGNPAELTARFSNYVERYWGLTARQ